MVYAREWYRPDNGPKRLGVTILILCGLMALLLIVGCKTATRAPDAESASDVRGRADTAFDDLAQQEAGQGGASPAPKKGSKTMEPAATAPPARVSTGDRPAWVSGSDKAYPITHYLTGVGLGGDRTTAEDHARAEIAKIFYSNVEANTRTYQGYFQRSEGGKDTVVESYDIKDITRVSTQKVLSGIRIAEVYDAKSATGDQGAAIYALAVLDRLHSQQMLTAKIESIDHEIQGLLAAAEAENDDLFKVKDLKGAMQKHVLREAYNTELRIVSPRGQGLSPKTDFLEIKDRLAHILLENFQVALDIRGDRAAEISAALTEGLNREGFAVGDDPNQVDVLVNGVVEIEPAKRGSSQWEYVRWQTRLMLVDLKSEATFGTINASGREGHLNRSEAEERAVMAMRKELAGQVAEKMTQFIFNRPGDE
jgi:hypothetical protein